MSNRCSRSVRLSLVVLLLCGLFAELLAAPPRRSRKPPAPKLPDLKTPEDKIKFLELIRNSFPALRRRSGSVYRSDDLDEQLERYVSRATIQPFAPLIDDERFARRAYLDLTGRPPNREQLHQFLNARAKDKRSQLIDQLLETDRFARKQARYWRSVVFSQSNANKNSVNPQAFEDWLYEEFKSGTGWDRIVGEMVSATPTRKKNAKPQDNGWHQDHGPNNFVLANERKPELIAASTARIFMGISIECAECHDHPFDNWKREQFHEMAAFFAPGKYYMTDQYDPTEKSVVEAKFLLGEKPPTHLKPDQRRVAGAAYLIYNPDNYWFARAYVNRVWNELIGDGFYSVDSLGQDKEVVHQLVVNRLSAEFRSAEFQPKWLYRIIMNSRAYQREIRTLREEADLFTAVRPVRLRPYEVADSVQQIVGDNAGLERAIQNTFDQNPSIPQRDLEGEVQQALLLMNNGTLNGKLANSALKKRMLAHNDDQELIREAFLGVLARQPTELELVDYKLLIQQSDNRDQAAMDILWVLINSAEFLTKR